MKKYVKPVMEGQIFASNEYVGACSDLTGGVKYEFVCDAGNKVKGGLYDLNWNLVSNDIDSFHACGETHESPADSLYFKGYFDPDTNHKNGNEIEVYIWEHEEKSCQYIPLIGNICDTYTNRHATTNLKMETWGKNHS